MKGLRSGIAVLRWWLGERLSRLYAVIIGHNLAEWWQLSRAGKVTVGPHTYGRPIVRHFPLDDAKLIVGSYSSLAENAIVMLGGNHGTDRVATYPHRPKWNMPGSDEPYNVPTGDTHIGSDVWLTEQVFLRSGVRIGDGAIIATCAVVTKDVPPFAIVGGNPARLIRYRYEPEQIEALLQIKWWDWPDADVREAVPLLEGTDVDAFIDWARTNKAHLISSSEGVDGVKRGGIPD